MVADFKKNQKRKPSKKIFFIFGGILLLLLLIVLIIADVKVYRKKKQLNTQIESLKNKIEEIKVKNEQLEQGIAKADDSQYIEKVAREELDLQMPGEKVFSFVVSPSEKQEVQENKKNFFQTWIDGFFGWIKNKF